MKLFDFEKHVESFTKYVEWMQEQNERFFLIKST